MRDDSDWKVKLSDGDRARMLKVADGAEAVATDIEVGTLVPGQGLTFRLADGGGVIPWCAFGHVLDRAGEKPRHQVGNNYVALSLLLGSNTWQCDDAWQDVRSALDILTSANDRGRPGRAIDPEVPLAARMLAKAVRKAAQP
jgi:hypothetical protein